MEALLEEDRVARQVAELEAAEEDLPEVRALPAPESVREETPKADPDRFFDLGYMGGSAADRS